MIGNNSTVKVTLVAVAQPYVTGLNQASTATRKLGTDIDRAGNQSKGFESKLGGASAAMKGLAAGAAALAGTALVKFFSDAVSAAGDLEQSIGGVDAVFGATSEKIHDFGKGAAESVGLSRNAFNELATVMGALLKNSGIDDFADATLELTQRAADVSATFGGTAKEAVEAFSSALKGEYNPIERYGVKLNETAVNASLAAKGLDKLQGAALEQAKAQERINLIMEQTADHAGRFAEEAGTLQGQQQRLNAEWENAKASLGEAFLPAMTDAVRMMREGLDAALAIAGAFDKIPQPVWAAAAALAAVHLAGGRIGAMALTVRTTMSAAGEAMTYAGLAAQRAGGGFAGAAAGLRTFTGQASLATAAARGMATAGRGALALVGGPWGAAFIGAAALVGKFMQSNAEAKARVEALTATLDEQTGAITKNTRAWVVDELEKAGVLKTSRQLGLDLEMVTDAALGNTAQMEALRKELLRLEPAMSDAGDANRVWADGSGALSLDLRNLEGDVLSLAEATGLGVEAALLKADAMGKEADATEAVGDAASAAVPTQAQLADEMEEAAKAAEKAKKEFDAYIDSLTASGLLVLSTRDAVRAYEKALDDAKEAAKEASGAVNKSRDAFVVSTEAGREAEEALDSQAKAAIRLAEAIYDETQSEVEFRASLKKSRDDLERTARDFGLSEDAAAAYADQILKIPDGVRTEIIADTTQATTRVLELQRYINGLKDRTITVRVATDTRSVGRVYSGQPVAFDSGGYTGKGARLEPAGVVHKGEFVHTKAELSKPGRLGFHYDLWRTGDLDAAYAKYKMRGYDSGGYVSSSAAIRSTQGIDYARLAFALRGSTAGASSRPVQVNIPVQTTSYVDPAAIGAQVAWQVGGLP